MWFSLITVLALSTNPQETVVKEAVDVVEYNHFYDEKARLVFDQMMLYRWNKHSCRYDLVCWRLVKSESQLPVYNPTKDSYTITWQDGDTLRQVTSNAWRETWTQYDPELEERSIMPKEHRQELINLKQRKEIITSVRTGQYPESHNTHQQVISPIP